MWGIAERLQVLLLQGYLGVGIPVGPTASFFQRGVYKSAGFMSRDLERERGALVMMDVEGNVWVWET
jgi:hypothetical protein